MPMRTAELTPEMQAELDALAALPEDQIDTNDIQEAPLANMMTGERGRYFRPTKTSITIRLDADLVDWFRTKKLVVAPSIRCKTVGWPSGEIG